MFAEACTQARGFTRPVILSRRRVDDRIFDKHGTLWGIESHTASLPLGFSPPTPGGKTSEKEHQRKVPGATKRTDVGDVLRLLLSFGADPNQRGINDYTPLHMAVAERNLRAVQMR